MITKPILVLLGLAVALTQVAYAQLTVDIHVFDFDFGTAAHVPLDPVIHPGDTIHWVWDSSVTSHSTTSAAGQAESWNSGLQSPGFTFDHTFTQLGTFNYYCTLHGFDDGGGIVSGMSGSITVSPVPEPGAWGLVAGAMLLGYAALRQRRHSQPMRVSANSAAPRL